MLCISAVAKNYSVVSPDGRLRANVMVGKTVAYQVVYNNQQLIAPSQISMTVDNGERWGVGSKLKGATTVRRNEIVENRR